MGNTSYSIDDRTARSSASGYYTKSRDEIFTQQKERKAHDEMNPQNVDIRDARDSEEHPNSFPLQIYLDVTGSMGHIPHLMIQDGLPTMISKIIQSGTPDVALLFGAIGDHECDRYPLQVSQFESGDEELDMWLTRTYLEGGGGGNNGESYALAWYFAANHVATDHYEKRGKKGVVITIGDEPFLPYTPLNALKEIMGSTCKAEGNVSAEVLLEQAMVQNEVYHIFLEHGYRRLDPAWKRLMGDHLIVVDDHLAIPDEIAEIVNKVSHSTVTTDKVIITKEDVGKVEDILFL